MNEAPSFWWRKNSFAGFALAPISWTYGWYTGRRMLQNPRAVVTAPVLCVGNFVAGGAGKTPTAVAIAMMARKMGRKPGFLSRGYGGRIVNPTIVEVRKHNARDVGDEPLLLAACGTTVVSPDRPNGARLLESQDVNFIIMDDGFQNPSLRKDYNLVVVDAVRGIGNGFAMPGGPLRANLGPQLMIANSVLVIGNANGADMVIRAAARRAKPVYKASIRSKNPRRWKGKRVIAFAGIADPDKFFASLAEAGAVVVEKRGFGDHHFLTAEEISEILYLAGRKELEIVTTTKDAARLRGLGIQQKELLARICIFETDLHFENQKILSLIIADTIRQAKAYRLGMN